MERKQMIRKCHVCGILNESENSEIDRCERCGKAFLPMNYFQRIRERALRAQSNPMEQLPEIPFNPLNGLLVFW